MKIDGNKPPESQDVNRVAGQKIAQPEPKVESKEKPASRGKAASADRVDISSKGKEVADLMAQIDKLPEVRADKVKQLAEAVANGTYTVDPAKVAEKIMKEI